LGKLGDAKMLGGIGSILLLVPGISIIGYVLILIAAKYVSDDLGDKTVFDNMVYAVITAIIGVAVVAFLLFTGLIFGAFTAGVGTILGVIGALVVIWVFLVISSLFIRRAYGTMATRLNVDSFRTAGTLYFVGALLSIVLVGFIILFVAYIFQIIAFFSIQEAPQPAAGQPMSTMASAPQAGMRFCPLCGAQMASSAMFCPKCGSRQSA